MSEHKGKDQPKGDAKDKPNGGEKDDSERGAKDESKNDESAEARGGDEDKPVGALEIIATVLSGLLVAAIIGVLLWDAAHPNTPAAFTTRPGTVSLASGTYRTPVSVKNTGDESAKSVMVHLELMAADSTLAESDLTIDWLPGGSSRDVVGYFDKPASGPNPTGVKATVRGFAVP